MAIKTVANPAAFVPLGGKSARYVNPETGETVSRRVILNSQRGQSVERFAVVNRVHAESQKLIWKTGQPTEPTVMVGGVAGKDGGDPEPVTSLANVIRAVHECDPTGKGEIAVGLLAVFEVYPSEGLIWRATNESTESLLKYLRESTTLPEAVGRSANLLHPVGEIHGVQLRRVR